MPYIPPAYSNYPCWAPASSPYAFPVSGNELRFYGESQPNQAVHTKPDDELLERILQRVTQPLQRADPFGALRLSRQLNLRDRISELVHQLEVRYVIHHDTSRRLKGARFETNDKLLNVQRLMRYVDPSAERRRNDLEKRLGELYRDEAREQHEFWKDQQKLREQLVEWLNEYRDQFWRSRLLDDKPGHAQSGP